MSLVWIYTAVTFASVVIVVLALYFYFGLYRRLTRLLHISSYKYLEYSLTFILVGSILIFTAFLLQDFEFLYKLFEIVSLIAFLLAFMLPFLGFRKFILDMSLLKTYLRGGLERYKIIIISVSGRLNTTKIIRDLASDLSKERKVFLTLGPTPPYHFSEKMAEKILWVTSRRTTQNGDKVVTIDENDPLRFNLELASISGGNKEYPILLGDHLNSFMRVMSEEIFYKYWSDSAFKIRSSNTIGVFIINEDIHNMMLVNLVKRYADILMELREVELKGTIKTQIRVINIVDDIYTEWITLPSLS